MERRIQEAYEPRRAEASQRCQQAWIRWIDQRAAANPP